MRTENEVKKLKKDLEKLTGMIANIDTSSDDFKFACNVEDALSWVLEEISTPAFLSNGYLNIEELQRIASKAEKEAISKIETEITEIVREEDLSLLANGAEWALMEFLKKMNSLELGVDVQKLEMILQEVLRKTGDPEVQELLQFLQDNRNMLENKVREELKRAEEELKEFIRRQKHSEKI